MSGDSPYLDALQAALAGEHAAVWASGRSAGELGGRRRDAARRELDAHRQARDELRRRVTALGAVPVEAAVAYVEPFPCRGGGRRAAADGARQHRPGRDLRRCRRSQRARRPSRGGRGILSGCRPSSCLGRQTGGLPRPVSSNCAARATFRRPSCSAGARHATRVQRTSDRRGRDAPLAPLHAGGSPASRGSPASIRDGVAGLEATSTQVREGARAALGSLREAGALAGQGDQA